MSELTNAVPAEGIDDAQAEDVGDLRAEHEMRRQDVRILQQHTHGTTFESVANISLHVALGEMLTLIIFFFYLFLLLFSFLLSHS